MLTRRLLQLLCLVPALALALEANAHYIAPQYKHLSGRRTVLIHTGNAALDDAVEEGFRLHWKFTPWSWAADTGMPKLKGDSSLYVFGNFPMYRWRVRGLFGCHGNWKDNKKGSCILQDSASSFSLYWVKGETHREILSEISELRSWPKGDAMAVDVVRDFNTALQVANDSILDGALLGQNDEWPGLVASAVGRQSCPACTVWVAREYGAAKPLDPRKMSSLLELPVEMIGMDSLDGLLGTSRKGLYLDAGSRSTFGRNLHLRTLDSGVLVATRTWRAGSEVELSPGLDYDDIAMLGHRLKGEEYRVVFSLSWFGQFSGNTFVHFVQGGYEFHRGWQALAGVGSTYDLVAESSSGDSKLTTLLGGVRWMPLLGYESSPLANRVVFDLTMQVPLGEGQQNQPRLVSDYYGTYTTSTTSWNAPAILNFGATTNMGFFELGGGLQIPLGDEYTHRGSRSSDGTIANSSWNLRMGIRTEWRGWRKAPSLFTRPSKAPTATTSSAPASSEGP